MMKIYFSILLSCYRRQAVKVFEEMSRMERCDWGLTFKLWVVYYLVVQTQFS